jgi:thiol:disulfide interchange protein
MKKVIIFLLVLFSVSGYSQVFTPVKWEASQKQLSHDTVEVTFKANIEKGWHIYSQLQTIKDGPIATSFTFKPAGSYKLIGSTNEGKSIKKLEPAFGNLPVMYFEKEALFTQKIAIQDEKNFQLNAGVTFMACNNNMCLPPETQELSVHMNAVSHGAGHSSVKAYLDSPQSTLSGWAIFIAGFIGGMLALLTPCVFPMLPLTVSFFTKQSKTKAKGIRNALIYALSIIVIYVTLGLTITFSLGPDALNALASNGIMNFAFFVIFVVFAVSFFGAFEITLPYKWLNASDKAADKGGLIGIFFMAFTLSLVSFSCTGPIIGSLLVQAAVNGDIAGPAIGMFGFSLALALPFAVFAAFPGWLNSLPKSGGWLNSVKVVLGFIELAFALKFLSAVDLAYHWGVLTREIFIALWIVISSFLGFYLLGKLRLPHDDEQKHTSISGLMMSILVFGFVVYLIPGMWGAPLKLISGFPPPSFYTEGWNQPNTSPASAIAEAVANKDNEAHCPYNLNCFHDYEEGLA